MPVLSLQFFSCFLFFKNSKIIAQSSEIVIYSKNTAPHPSHAFAVHSISLIFTREYLKWLRLWSLWWESSWILLENWHAVCPDRMPVKTSLSNHWHLGWGTWWKVIDAWSPHSLLILPSESTTWQCGKISMLQSKMLVSQISRKNLAVTYGSFSLYVGECDNHSWQNLPHIQGRSRPF